MTSSEGDGRAANVLGALSLVVADKMADAVTGASRHSVTAATALSALYHFLDHPSVDLLRQVLGLTPSGTVRLIDRLEDDGYVTRGPGPDGRTIAVSLTESGRRAAAAVAAARSAVLSDLLGTLPAEDRAALESIASRLLAGMMLTAGPKPWICRLCDTKACGHEDGRCPITQAVAQARGN